MQLHLQGIGVFLSGKDQLWIPLLVSFLLRMFLTIYQGEIKFLSAGLLRIIILNRLHLVTITGSVALILYYVRDCANSPAELVFVHVS